MCDVFLFLGWQDPVPEPDPEPVIKLMQSTKNGRWYVWHKELQKSAWLPARQNAAWEVMEDPSCGELYLKDHGSSAGAGVLWVAKLQNC